MIFSHTNNYGTRLSTFNRRYTIAAAVNRKSDGKSTKMSREKVENVLRCHFCLLKVDLWNSERSRMEPELPPLKPTANATSRFFIVVFARFSYAENPRPSHSPNFETHSFVLASFRKNGKRLRPHRRMFGDPRRTIRLEPRVRFSLVEWTRERSRETADGVQRRTETNRSRFDDCTVEDRMT